MTSCLALIRVRLPDRPGALGLVASRIGALKGDIVGIEVLDRADDVAVDELAVVLPDASVVTALTREIAEVDGVTTESIVIVDALPEPRLDGFRIAIALSRSSSIEELLSALAAEATHALRATWCAVVRAHDLLAATAGAPRSGPDAKGAADHRCAIGQRGATLLIALPHPVRYGEQQLIDALCELASTLWGRLDSP